jgi:hypothetical protein
MIPIVSDFSQVVALTRLISAHRNIKMKIENTVNKKIGVIKIPPHDMNILLSPHETN